MKHSPVDREVAGGNVVEASVALAHRLTTRDVQLSAGRTPSRALPQRLPDIAQERALDEAIANFALS
jgi:hypothetical protein